MPTAVLDLDIENLPNEINNLSGYSKALILLRFKGNPVGQVTIPAHNGTIYPEEHFNKIVNPLEPDLWKNQLHYYINWNERDVIECTPPTATVAICTRNRSEDLKRTLHALMNLPDDGQQILVVDNCPTTNDTENLVKEFPCVQYIRESRKGLNIARNRALLEATTEIVAFTDDDATPDPSWLRTLLRNFNHPSVICVTGLTIPLELETKAQEIFEQYCPFGKGFTRKIFTNQNSNPLSTGNIGAGANMALRRSVLHEVGFFDEALDSGTPTHSGGDHEMFARILMKGYKIIYDPYALSRHRHRRTMKELKQTLYGYGVGVYSLLTRHLILNGEMSAFKIAFSWFRYKQLPTLIKSLLRRPGYIPMPLLMAELMGCAVGTGAYFYSRHKQKKQAYDNAGNQHHYTNA